MRCCWNSSAALGTWIGQRRLLLIATHRPEFKVDWQDWPHLETISLGALPIHACHAIATSVAHELDEEIRAAIVERSDGVPLFVEEFARALADQTTSDGRLPGSISQLMLSRLDLLGPARTGCPDRRGVRQRGIDGSAG